MHPMLVRASGFALAALALACPVVGAERKIGYFDVNRILSEVEEAKAAKQKLQKEFEEKQKTLDEERAELEKFQKDLQQKAPVLSQSAKEQMAIEYQGRIMKAQQNWAELRQDLAQKEQQALADLLMRLEPVVREIAEAEGYTYIFEKNEAGLFYGPSADDLTPQLIRRYNSRHPSGGAKSADKKPGKGGDKK
jgi:outer membrane protein